MILSQVAEKNNDYVKAIDYAIAAKELLKNRSSEFSAIYRDPASRIDYKISELRGKTGNSDLEIAGLSILEGATRSVASVKDDSLQVIGFKPVPEPKEIYLRKAEIFEKQGRWGDVAVTYEKALELEKGEPKLKFAYVRSLRKKGGIQNLAKAKNILEEIVKAEKDGFWKKMAQEALVNDEIGK